MVNEERRFSFLSLNFHNYTMDEVVDKLEYFIHNGSPHMVSTITAELVVRANEYQALREIYNCTDLLTIDSYIVYYAARLFRKPAAKPVHATRLAFRFLPVMDNKAYSLYLVGAKEHILQQAVKNLKIGYPNVNIVGFHHGYFDIYNDKDVIEDIKEKKPDVLFVGMSSPLKENFIANNLKEMNVPVCIALGGGIDIMAGKCELAPVWISEMGLEWFYRLIQEPQRMWKKYFVTNTKFLFLLIKELLGRKRTMNN